MAFCKYCGTKLEDGQVCNCADAVRAATKKAEEAAKLEAEKAAAEAERLEAEKAAAEAERLEAEKAAAEAERLEAEKAAAEAAKLEAERAAAKAEKNKAEKTESEAVKIEAEEPVIEEKKPDPEKSADEAEKDKQAAENGRTVRKAATAPPAVVEGENAKAMRRGLILVFTAAALFIMFIVVLASLLGDGYKTPLKKTVKGINKSRAELVIDAVYPDAYINELKEKCDDDGGDWDETVDDLSSFITDMKELCEDEHFGSDVTANVKILDKKEITSRDRRNIEQHFENMGADVKKASKLKIEITVKGDEEKETIRVYVFTVKLDDGKWVVYADDRAMGRIVDKAGSVSKGIGSSADELLNDYSDVFTVFKEGQ
ncbi:MAG: hypothetical protein K5979_06265 [Ruminococcus sp.]|nr:hypothetical protein [Ruminococcus sp.]